MSERLVGSREWYVTGYSEGIQEGYEIAIKEMRAEIKSLVEQRRYDAGLLSKIDKIITNLKYKKSEKT